MKDTNNIIKKPSRIVLEKEAQESLTKMLASIREEGKFIKISPTRLASWIILQFESKHFLKQKDSIIKAHFSSKNLFNECSPELRRFS